MIGDLGTQCNKANKVLAEVEYPDRLSRTTLDNDTFVKLVPKGEMKQSNGGRTKKKKSEIKSKSNSKSQQN